MGFERVRQRENIDVREGKWDRTRHRRVVKRDCDRKRAFNIRYAKKSGEGNLKGEEEEEETDTQDFHERV